MTDTIEYGVKYVWLDGVQQIEHKASEQHAREAIATHTRLDAERVETSLVTRTVKHGRWEEMS